MSYIGATPAESYASFYVQHFTTSATTSYALDYPVVNENDLRLVINNVVQQPGSGYAYTAAASTLTLSAATTTSDTMYAVFLGRALQTVNPPADSVGGTQLADSAISGQTALGAEPADTDEFLVSDAGVLKRMDYSYIKAPAAGGWGFVEAVTASDDATISFSTAFVDGFDYQVTATNLFPASESYWLQAQFGTGPTTWLTSSYRGCAVSISNGASVSGREVGSEIAISAVEPGNAANEDGSFTMWIPQPYASVYTQCQGVTGCFNTSSAGQSGTFFGLQHSSTSVTYIKFYYSGGNVREGIFKLYKRANA